MENSVNTSSADDDKIGVGELVRMFEDSEQATLTARANAERDRDYYDSIQYTDDELATLKKRGQPPVIDNRIKTKIDYLVGLEKSQRIDPRALPRTPAHEEDANGASQALKYVADTQDYDQKRSMVWRNLLIEGAGGVSVAVEQGNDGPRIVLRRWAWDRMFWDAHSSEPDFSDAGYIGGVVWMDHADAVVQYPDKVSILDAALTQTSNLSETYDDKPKYSVWADSKRKRIRVCQIWLKRAGQWYFAEYTKAGILKAGASPYKNEYGESDCEMIFQSAYVTRDNDRYGLVREMVSLQDSINKRNSKALHLLNTSQIVYEEGAFDSAESARREVARPDGALKVNPGFMDKVRVDTRLDLAQSHFQLLQDAKSSIDLKGPNATMMGDKAQGSSAASGRAILASQQGGMVQLGDLMDHLRHFDKRVFRAIWNRIRQFWDAEKWVRVTDDERNVKWVAINVDPQRLQMMAAERPEMIERLAGTVSNVAELDCDIIIDEVPDAVAPALEQWQSLVELASAGVTFPKEVYIKSAPNLKNKTELLDIISKPDEGALQAQQIQMAGATAKVDETNASAMLKQAQAEKTMIEAQLAPAKAHEDAMQGRAGLMQSRQREVQPQEPAY